ncbi:hypothetical protein [Chitinophaga agrisoli]|nr:hypothetical protein [Chitinophaga agrisoli]
MKIIKILFESCAQGTAVVKEWKFITFEQFGLMDYEFESDPSP